MKELKKTLFLSIIYQLLCWIPMIIACEFDKDIGVYLGVTCLVILIILYFIYKYILLKDKNYTNWKYNLFFGINSIVLIYIILTIVSKLLSLGILSHCVSTDWNCFLNGLEYLVFAIYDVISIGIIISIEIIVVIVKYIIKKIKRSDVK